jgi:indolepyruvate ferredoxin oxidoreductase alpha subunit
MTPDKMSQVLERACAQAGVKIPHPRGKALSIPDAAPLRKPNLCAGCGHRGVFYALRRAFPGGIFPGDIGCYTLGINQGAVDTCHDMGASINFAASFSRMLASQGLDTPVLATIGDSTFYHSGPAGLVNSVYNQARFVLLILDNAVTSMTGMQPTPGTGITAQGRQGGKVDLTALVRGCGVKVVEEVDAYDLPALLKILQKTYRRLKSEDGPAVVICRRACVSHNRELAVDKKIRVEVSHKSCNSDRPKPRFSASECINCGLCVKICPPGALHFGDKGIIELDAGKCISCRQCARDCPTGAMDMPAQGCCTACGVCLHWFACPGLTGNSQGHVVIDRNWCVDCGFCIKVCAQEAINEKKV